MWYYYTTIPCYNIPAGSTLTLTGVRSKPILAALLRLHTDNNALCKLRICVDVELEHEGEINSLIPSIYLEMPCYTCIYSKEST